MLNRIRNRVSGNGGFTIIELVAVLVVLGIIVSFAVARMSNNTETFKEKAMVPLANAWNTFESLNYAKEYIEWNGFSNLAAMEANTFDPNGLQEFITANPDYSIDGTFPADSTVASTTGVLVKFQNSLNSVQLLRVSYDANQQCRWEVQ